MRRTLSLAVFVVATAAVAACTVPTAPESTVCRNTKIPGACAVGKDYINPVGDYINPVGRDTTDTTNHGG